jgi:hypothetical protein
VRQLESSRAERGLEQCVGEDLRKTVPQFDFCGVKKCQAAVSRPLVVQASAGSLLVLRA